MTHDRPIEVSRSHGPLHHWGQFVVRHRTLAVALPVLLALFLLPLALTVQDRLSSGGWLPAGAEAVAVDHRLVDEFGRHTTSHYLLFTDPAGELTVDDTGFQREMARTLVVVRQVPGVTAVYTASNAPSPAFGERLVAADRSAAIAIVQVNQNVKEAAKTLPALLQTVTSPVLTVEIGGWPAITHDFQSMTSRDLVRAEAISLPITLLLLVLIFGGIIVAGLPVVVTVAALVPALAGVAITSMVIETSVFTINVVIMIGLALGIDYSLILVSRYREELRASSPSAAMVTTIETAGRTIIASGAAVATGLAGLLAFGAPAATATAIAAALVVVTGVVASLTMLPGLLLLVGSRQMGRRQRAHKQRAWLTQWWPILARNPGRWLSAAVLGLALLAVPVLQLQPVMPSMEVIPESQPSRQMLETTLERFPDLSLSPMTVIVEPRRGPDMTSRRNLDRLETLITDISVLEGVGGVTSVWSFLPARMTPAAIANSLALEPGLARIAQPYLTRSAAVIEISLAPGSTSGQAEDLVRFLRENGLAMSDGDLNLMVGGEAAMGVDMMFHLDERAPWTLGIVLSLAMLVLAIQFRSVLLPVKAILLNMLALAAAFGLVVLVFQEGAFAGILANSFTGADTGTTVVIVPLLMFCFMFGLSMDYEIIMLSRIRESWQHHGDNRRAVHEGMIATTNIVTRAALIMVVVFGAFASSDLQIIREIGIGLAIAVIIDATIIRLIALPSAMLLMGRWNWWFPGLGQKEPETLANTRSPLHAERSP